MTPKHRKKDRIQWLTFAEYREDVFGPIQSQLLLLSVFLLPAVIRFAYYAGLPRSESLTIRIFIAACSMLLLWLVYSWICRLLGVPAVLGNQKCQRKSPQ